MTVYFIQAGNDGPVKIGMSENIPRRLANLQGAHFDTLRVIRQISGNGHEERLLHGHFSHLKIRGEWFLFDAEMLTIDPDLLIPEPSKVPSAPPVNRKLIRRIAKGLSLTTQAVYAWPRVPAEKIVRVEEITGIPREELRPDLYRPKRQAS